MPAGANMTINCLHYTLEKPLGLEDLNGNKLDHLVIQLDNWRNENKNSLLFGYIALLVQLGVAQEVQLMFIMVGHRHVVHSLPAL
ncbi:unnamed protein product [Discosporangium mesarthrocarpum]